MRRVVVGRRAERGIVRAMVCDSAEGVYLFLYKDMADGPCAADELFASLEEAQSHAVELLAVGEGDWTAIGPTLPGCQDDWIAPVRMKRYEDGRAEVGRFKRFEGGRWIEASVGQ